MSTKKENQQIKKAAQSWRDKIDDGLSTQHKQQLIAWCNQDKRHYHALEKQLSSNKGKALIQNLAGIFPVTEKKHSEIKFQILLLITAITIAIVSLSWLFNFNPLSLIQSNSEQQYQQNKRLVTLRGEQQQYVLSDGSTLYLNTDTIVAINFDRNHRQLELIRGEAKFNVARDVQRPFTVTTGNQSFTALGTTFNLEKITNDHMELLVTTGQVLITQANNDQEISAELFSTKSQNLPGLLVNASDSAIKAVINNNIHEPLQPLTAAQVQQDLSWQQGILIFNGEQLPAVLEEIQRYHNLTFSIDDPELMSLEISGYFKTHDPQEILHLLKFSFNIAYQINDGNIVSLKLKSTPS